MRLLKTKNWYWWDIGLLKRCCFLLGMVAGSYCADIVKSNVAWLLLVAFSLGIRPASDR